MNALALLSALLVAGVFWRATLASVGKGEFSRVLLLSHLLSLTVLVGITAFTVCLFAANDISFETVYCEIEAQQAWRVASMLVGTLIILASIIGVWLAIHLKRSRKKVSGTDGT